MKIKLTYLLLIISLFFIFWNLDKDCSILQRIGHYGDEGYWLQNSISTIDNGVPMIDKQSLSFFGAPLYYHILTLQFSIFGISIFNARILSILFFLLTTWIIFLILRTQIKNKLNCLLYSVMFLLLFDNKIYYQWATPVPLEIFFQSLLLLFLIKQQLIYKWKIVIGIILIYLCILSKTNSIWLIGLLLMVYFYDNKFLLKPLKVFIIFIICIIPYLLITWFFNLIEPEKYLIFNDFLKGQIRFNIDFFNNFLNPIYYLEQLSGIFKFPNSSFLLILFCIGMILHKTIKLNRKYIILIGYIGVLILFLIVIGQFGYDRRQINLIVPIFLLSIFIYDNCKDIIFTKKQILIICSIFLIILIIQIKHLYSYIFILNSIKELRQFILELNILDKILTMSITSIFVLFSCFLLYKYRIKFLFWNFIVLNLLFHILFYNNKNTLREGSKKIQDLAIQYKVKTITGINAHQLAIETNLYPLWWLTNYKNFPDCINNIVIIKNTPIIIITDMDENKKSGYYPIKNCNILKKDTLYLHWNKFRKVYSDTLILNIINDNK